MFCGSGIEWPGEERWPIYGFDLDMVTALVPVGQDSFSRIKPDEVTRLISIHTCLTRILPYMKTLSPDGQPITLATEALPSPAADS
jgi:hypothetical protein